VAELTLREQVCAAEWRHWVDVFGFRELHCSRPRHYRSAQELFASEQMAIIIMFRSIHLPPSNSGGSGITDSTAIRRASGVATLRTFVRTSMAFSSAQS
jgi:hypothetical protein